MNHAAADASTHPQTVSENTHVDRRTAEGKIDPRSLFKFTGASVAALGIELVADFYVPRDIDSSRRHPALMIGHPYGGVKEQTSGLYAQTMAERGSITLAHDASYNGESGGQTHFISSPEAVAEDFSAGVDFLGTHKLVDRNRIGVIRVGASGGFALAAAQIDAHEGGRDRQHV